MQISWSRPFSRSERSGRARWRIERLQRLPGLTACRTADLRTLDRLGDEAVLPAGELLVRQGDVPRWVYLIVEGGVVVSDGASVGWAGPGAWIGAGDAALRLAADHTVVASADTTVLAFGTRTFFAALEQAPSVALAVVRSAVRPADRAVVGDAQNAVRAGSSTALAS